MAIIELPIKPLSVNDVWKGMRFKTPEYKRYAKVVGLMLRGHKLVVPDGPLMIHFEWGFSSEASDVDNPTKPFLDILSKFYGFNDNRVYRIILDKIVVGKGKELVRFEIFPYTK